MCASVVLLGRWDLRAESEVKSVEPVSPRDLLTVLPSTPNGWKMTVSRSSNSLSTWLTATAVREFEYTSQPEMGSGSSNIEGLRQTTRYMISDSGYAPPSGDLFRDFKVGKERGVERLIMWGMPAMRFEAKPGGAERLIFWIKNRFLVTIETKNQRTTKIDSWARLINFSTLAALAQSATRPLSNPVTITNVDEVNKEGNRSYQLYWSYASEQE